MRALMNVHVTHPKTGLRVLIEKGDEIPEDLAPLITNPKVTGVEAESESGGSNESSGDVGEGPLDGRTVKQLRALAAAQDPEVDLSDAKVKDEMVSALESAGVSA